MLLLRTKIYIVYLGGHIYEKEKNADGCFFWWLFDGRFNLRSIS